jgi:hypothetical protein
MQRISYIGARALQRWNQTNMVATAAIMRMQESYTAGIKVEVDPAWDIIGHHQGRSTGEHCNAYAAEYRWIQRYIWNQFD